MHCMKRFFPSLDTIVKETEIILIAAASDVPTYIRMHEGKAYLIIDLIQVANLTRIVAAMMHVIDNFICLETAMRCIAAEWPVSALSYTEKLDWICFRQGLANWLAWGEDSTVYQFPKGAKGTCLGLIQGSIPGKRSNAAAFYPQPLPCFAFLGTISHRAWHVPLS